MASSATYGEPWTRTEWSPISCRDRWAALRFFRKLLHTAERAPRVIITDKLRSYAAAKKLILTDVIHRQSRHLNNRAENSHQPTRWRERQMKRFRSLEQAQRFLTTFESISAPFRLCRHLLSATRHRWLLKQAFQLWNHTALANFHS
jgi:putative transposase